MKIMEASNLNLKADQLNWSIDEMIVSAKSWSLAGDNALLNYMKDYSKRLISQTHELQSKLNSLQTQSDLTDARLHNIFNEFNALANYQFIENRVYDEEVTNESLVQNVNSKQNEESELLKDIYNSVSLGFQLVDSLITKDNNQQPSFLNETDHDKALIFEDPYKYRPLLPLIGSEDFFNFKEITLISDRADSNKEIDKLKMPYNFSENEINGKAHQGSFTNISISSKQSMDAKDIMPDNISISSTNTNIANKNLFLDIEESDDDEELFKKPSSLFNTVQLPNNNYIQDNMAKAAASNNKLSNEKDLDTTSDDNKKLGNSLQDDKKNSKKKSLFDDDDSDNETDLFQQITSITKQEKFTKDQEKEILTKPKLKIPVGGISIFGNESNLFSNNSVKSKNSKIPPSEPAKVIEKQKPIEGIKALTEELISKSNLQYESSTKKNNLNNIVTTDSDIFSLKSNSRPINVINLFEDVDDEEDDIFAALAKITNPTEIKSFTTKKNSDYYEGSKKTVDKIISEDKVVKPKIISNLFDNQDDDTMDLFSENKTRKINNVSKEIPQVVIDKRLASITDLTDSKSSTQKISTIKDSDIKKKETAKSKKESKLASIFSDDSDDSDIFSALSKSKSNVLPTSYKDSKKDIIKDSMFSSLFENNTDDDIDLFTSLNTKEKNKLLKNEKNDAKHISISTNLAEKNNNNLFSNVAKDLLIVNSEIEKISAGANIPNKITDNSIIQKDILKNDKQFVFENLSKDLTQNKELNSKSYTLIIDSHSKQILTQKPELTLFTKGTSSNKNANLFSNSNEIMDIFLDNLADDDNDEIDIYSDDSNLFTSNMEESNNNYMNKSNNKSELFSNKKVNKKDAFESSDIKSSFIDEDDDLDKLFSNDTKKDNLIVSDDLLKISTAIDPRKMLPGITYPSNRSESFEANYGEKDLIVSEDIMNSKFETNGPDKELILGTGEKNTMIIPSTYKSRKCIPSSPEQTPEFNNVSTNLENISNFEVPSRGQAILNNLSKSRAKIPFKRRPPTIKEFIKNNCDNSFEENSEQIESKTEVNYINSHISKISDTDNHMNKNIKILNDPLFKKEEENIKDLEIKNFFNNSDDDIFKSNINISPKMKIVSSSNKNIHTKNNFLDDLFSDLPSELDNFKAEDNNNNTINETLIGRYTNQANVHNIRNSNVLGDQSNNGLKSIVNNINICTDFVFNSEHIDDDDDIFKDIDFSDNTTVQQQPSNQKKTLANEKKIIYDIVDDDYDIFKNNDKSEKDGISNFNNTNQKLEIAKNIVDNDFDIFNNSNPLKASDNLVNTEIFSKTWKSLVQPKSNIFEEDIFADDDDLFAQKIDDTKSKDDNDNNDIFMPKSKQDINSKKLQDKSLFNVRIKSDDKTKKSYDNIFINSDNDLFSDNANNSYKIIKETKAIKKSSKAITKQSLFTVDIDDDIFATSSLHKPDVDKLKSKSESKKIETYKVENLFDDPLDTFK